MILKSYRILLNLLIFSILFSPLKSEEEINIWKNKKDSKNIEIQNSDETEKKNKLNINKILNSTTDQEIKIEDGSINPNEEIKVFGIYDPEDFDFNLNMWAATDAEDVRASIKRLKKINLSKTSNEILENVLLSFSYPPKGMKDEEFVNLKIDWLFKNNRSDLIENFIIQNKEFKGKGRAVQYLVDESISQANIKQGCEKIKFIDSTIKDAYLEKFKIYCLVFNNKNSQAQLLLDLLREQNQSDKFFDDKINFLLGISEKTTNKINEKNLLNFYLSSVTIKDFKYSPSEKTKEEIWKYLNAANLIKLENISDKEKIKELELAVHQGQVDEKIIFDIYQQIPFNLNSLINAKNIYQTLDPTDARSLIFQKYLLSETIENKLEYLFILDDLFKKDKLQNAYSKVLSESLKEIGKENIPDNYRDIVNNKIISEDSYNLAKVKYNDKVFHQSKIIKFYLEKEDEKKTQKDIDKVFKKLIKNKKYFFSAKDLALVDSLVKDGFKIPENFSRAKIAEKYEVPKNLLQLVENEQNAFLALKIVEIIGEDEPYQLDAETIYFITDLLNRMNLIKLRNKVLISALPQRA